MRVAVTSMGNDLSGEVEQRFGRAPWFLLVDPETMEFEAVENTQSTNLPQGAGIQAAENISRHNPAVVLTGNCGPKAFKVLQAAGIGVVVGVKGKIEDAVRAYARGDYQSAGEANVEGHWM
ncbi:MAG: NifB/NifX family molybdenum-iron cluster-binding protein [Thermodesulfobacteriota bacterium]